MSSAREWGIPVALGLLAAVALWAVPGSDDGAAPDAGHTDHLIPVPTIQLPFSDSWGPTGQETTLLLVAPQGRPPAWRAFNESQADDFAELRWVGDRLAYYTAPNLSTGCQDADGDGNSTCSDPYWVSGSWPLPRTYALAHNDTGPRLGLDGYNATRATIYVFDERGLLAATNDAEGNWSRFDGAPTTMDSAVWYIGANQTAPEGTQRVPSFAAPLLQRLRPLMEGLPVGGVASTQSNAYVSLYGTLFLTVRIDELVYAP